MRNVVFFMCAIQLLAAGIITYEAMTVQTDAAGRGMAQGFAMVIGLAVAVFGLPAFLMALANRWLPLAAVLGLMPLVVMVFLLG